MDTMKNTALLLEIGTEEIPARFLLPAISDLKRIASDIFTEYRVSFQSVNTYATPRRIVLIMEGVSAAQADVVKEVFGPSKKAAYDDAGRPTKAAEGFAGSLGISVTDLVVKTKGKGDYVAALIEEKGTETRAVMPDILRKIVLSLRFPKSMRWGSGSMTFARPIHWIAALLGAETVTFEIDGIKSSSITRGHRFLSPASFQVRDIPAYAGLLETNFVILDQDKRKKMIRDGITGMAAESGGTPLLDEELLETVNYLVEYPVPVLCGFHSEYLSLPKELLITVMKDHQKYFAILDGAGNLVNKFVVISNTRAENGDNVRTGAERVIRARFDDAKFYFREDRKRTLADRVEDLKKVTFQDQLGSLHAKTQRLIAMATRLAEAVAPAARDRVARAALLSKTDLITGVVREFPELQGVMARYYAGHDGEEREVSEALEEQYLPKSHGAMMPASETGALLSLADKIENVASFFSIGLVPTGSEDPFALRRQAMGIVSILLQRGYTISIRRAFEDALADMTDAARREKTLGAALSFMEQRVEFILTSMGYETDLVKAVLPLAVADPLTLAAGRLPALKEFRQDPAYPDFLTAIKRVNNILPKVPVPGIRPELLSVPQEKELAAELYRVTEALAQALTKGAYADALAHLASLTGPINSFFDKVLVMDKDEAVKNNRLSLLKEIWAAACRVADFSKLS